MTQEEKQLLLKDLCARLPYGVNLYVEGVKKLPDNEHISVGFIGGYALSKEGCQEFTINEVLEELDNGSNIKLYLRPMSSMTEKERKIVNNLIYNKESIWTSPVPVWVINESDIEEYIDFCNSHHLDYRSLIEKGLAFEAKEGMYKDKEL